MALTSSNFSVLIVRESILVNNIIHRKLQFKIYYKLYLIRMLLSLIISVIVGVINCDDTRLVVVYPPELKKLQSKPQIRLSAFSKKTQNLNIYGNLHIASPFDACHDLTNIITSEISNSNFFILADGKSCSHRKKARHAKKLGASAIIILNDDYSKQNQPYSKFSDGDLFVFELEESQGIRIQTYMTNNEISSAYVDLIYKVSESPKSKVQIWISSLDEASYKYLEMWRATLNDIPVLKDLVTWRPRYVIYGCENNSYDASKDCGETKTKLTCACGGQFCSPTEISQNNNEAVMEDFRQKQIYARQPDKYFAYVEEINNKCYKKFKFDGNIYKCSENIGYDVGVNIDNINEKVNQTVTNCNNDIYANMILDRERYSEIGEYPAVALDRQILSFDSPQQFRVLLCQKLLIQQEQGCRNAIQIQAVKSKTPWYFYFFLILGIVVSAVLVFICYRRKIRKDLNKQMKMQVSTAVQHYFSLTETKV